MNRSKENAILPIELYPDGVLIADTSSLKILHVNEKAGEILNSTPQEIKNNSIDILFKRNTRLIQAIRLDCISEKKAFHYSLTRNKKQKKRLLIQLAKHRDTENRVALFIKDITIRRELEEQLRIQLEHHKTMTNELHHRVKNNLSIVSSLISLKGMQLGNPEILTDLSCQVDAIQSIHEQLIHQHKAHKVKIKPYLSKVAKDALHAFGCERIKLRIQIADVYLSSRQATTLGLILNEITTNTCKHAVRENGDEKIKYKVEFETARHEGKRGYLLTTENTGAPIPEEIDPLNSGGLGMRLIQSMIAELRGTMSLQKAPHPRYRIWFPA